MAPIIQAVLALGPSVLRFFGKSKGGNVEKVTEAVASIIDSSNGKPPTQLIENELIKLTPDEFSSFSVELERIAAEREKNRLDYDVQMHSEQQKTIRSSKDLKGVRPEVASRHSWFTFIYIIVAEILNALDYGDGASIELAVVILSPTLAFFGFRTWDKFSPQGASLGLVTKVKRVMGER